ncbi:MAG: T9SS type A sorting domain-containing protein [Bacteroidota bacterium]|jgi:hypothetical protein|nr:T9SS type A sorting domain-containing protein [Bacteroidota bacterium]
MSRLLIIRNVCLLTAGILLCSAYVIHAQSVLQGYGAKVLLSGGDGRTRVDLRMTDHGEALVWWESGGTWLRGDGSDLERPLPSGKDVQRILAVHDTNWIGLQYQPERNMPGLYDIYIRAGHGETALDPAVFVGSDGSTAFNDNVASVDQIFFDISLNGDTIRFVTDRRGHVEDVGLHYDYIQCNFVEWQVGNENNTLLHLIRPEEIPDSTGWFGHILMNDMLRASDVRDDLVALYWRRGGGRASIFAADTVYIESVLLMKPSSGTVIDSCVVDTVSSAGLNRTPRILPPHDGTVDIIRNDAANTGLFADRYATDGTHLGHFPLADRVVLEAPDPAFRNGSVWEDEISMASKMDYDLLTLDDGSRLLAWSEATGGTGKSCYLRLFDRDWNPLGQIRQVHEDTTGLQYHPVLAASGELCMIAWMSRRNFRDTLFVRSFLRDQVLDAGDPPPVADGLRVRGPWPQPARRNFMMNVEVPQAEHSVVLECRDILGRRVLHWERNTNNGRLRFSEDVSGLLSGLYFITIHAGDAIQLRKLLVE